MTKIADSRPSGGYPPIEGPPTRTWHDLTREIRACRRCPLGSQREHAVVYRGGSRPWLVFVGEAPGSQEDREGRPFVGRGGRILDRAIEDAGLGKGEYGILNLLKCRPPKNRFDPGAARACRPYLDRQLQLLKPTCLVPLGRYALRALDPTAPPIMQAAGTPRTPASGPPVFPLIHPAASLRSRAMAKRWRSDAVRLRAWVAGQRPQST
ncbi:MAG: uracil-DNA glycosylase [Candidatus Thermoplasmatota archaeon]|nr:uracil-DNA glycosylase [Candidatus Thermoplasmatota archaeon]MCL5983575.1 uracil-DNA glycosylase [Candidatus Thermoplasmatota archaeon]